MELLAACPVLCDSPLLVVSKPCSVKAVFHWELKAWVLMPTLMLTNGTILNIGLRLLNWEPEHFLTLNVAIGKEVSYLIIDYPPKPKNIYWVIHLPMNVPPEINLLKHKFTHYPFCLMYQLVLFINLPNDKLLTSWDVLILNLFKIYHKSLCIK